MEKTDTTTRRIVVHGRVQGVGFRISLREEARTRRVRGWVRNRVDGTVEAILQGAPHDVEAVVAWARQGPTTSEVTRLHVEDTQGDFATFELRPTA